MYVFVNCKILCFSPIIPTSKRIQGANDLLQPLIKPYFEPLGIIHLVRTQIFQKNEHFLPPDMHTQVYVSGG